MDARHDGAHTLYVGVDVPQQRITTTVHRTLAHVSVDRQNLCARAAASCVADSGRRYWQTATPGV